jgi:hypothetical protein
MDDDVIEVSRMLNAKKGEVIVRTTGYTAYAISCSLLDTVKERLIVLRPDAHSLWQFL